MKRRRISIAGAFLAAVLLVLAVVVQASAPPSPPTYHLVRDVVSSGGVVGSTDLSAASEGEANTSAPYPTGFILHGTLGQTAIGYARLGPGGMGEAADASAVRPYGLLTGFWFWTWRALDVPRRFMPIVFEQYSP